jgi:hypothetical protein
VLLLPLPAPAGLDARLKQLLTQTNDNAVLNRTVVEAFLQRVATVASRADLPSFDPEPFIGVANLVVNLLWTLRADALLTLLREYATTGVFDVTQVDQDALVREVQTVLLELFSRRNIVKENEDGTTNPWLVSHVMMPGGKGHAAGLLRQCCRGLEHCTLAAKHGAASQPPLCTAVPAVHAHL